MSVVLKPLGNRLIVDPIQEEEVTARGIFLPETAKKKPQKGKVLAVGPGQRLKSGERQEMTIEVGDQVLYAQYAGTEIKLGDREVLILSEDDILATIG